MAIPMRVIKVDGLRAVCEARGEVRDVSLMLLMDADVAPGDHLAVHLGRATEKLDADRAREVWAVYDLMLGTPAQPPRARA